MAKVNATFSVSKHLINEELLETLQKAVDQVNNLSPDGDHVSLAETEVSWLILFEAGADRVECFMDLVSQEHLWHGEGAYHLRCCIFTEHRNWKRFGGEKAQKAGE